ncbi:outer membrane protein assembly factor BamD [Sungkyunkwania multivorans]|uniref:Outer membrane protein assembly factor BamD n=1 Tax=Sungkyunkwania multivorans TaxID=1173618 RepID=A0ABW3CXH2_9FLAO
MRNLICLIGILVLGTSCSEYQDALKSTDVKLKYDLAEKLYNEGDYKKANRLFEQIAPKFAGKPQGERVVYFMADSYYKTEDFYLAGYQFDRFSRSYPRSEKAETAAFLGAKSYYQLSPRYSIDQKETIQAIDKLQSFINSYPNSPDLPEANNMVQELQVKLEKKAFEIAKQYNTIRDYKSAIKAFDNFIADYPGTPYREKALYYKLHSSYTLAINSFEVLKPERLREAKLAYNNFTRYYSESEYMDEVEEMGADIDKELENIQDKI